MQELTQAKQKSAGFLNQVFANFNVKKYDERIRSYARKWLGLERSGLNGILLQQILGAVERMEKVKSHSSFIIIQFRSFRINLMKKWMLSLRQAYILKTIELLLARKSMLNMV
jgi:hypothetical protein